MKKILTIIRKEWAEVFKNRMVIFTVLFLPLIMTAIPLGVLYSTRGPTATTNTEIPSEMTTTLCPGISNSKDCMQIFLVSEFMMLFMLLPVAIPVTIAAYSIVGEKTTRSLEPLLATPITTMELLVGKSLAAVIPGVCATYGAFAIFVVGSWIMLKNKILLTAIIDLHWLIAVIIVGPLIAILAVAFAIMVSSRVNDPRVAEQISMIIILPVLAGFFGQVAGLFVLNTQLILIVGGILAVLDAIMLYLTTKVFQRELILTRWK
jgi:ABC-2 type transport system permease protein